MIGEKVVIRRIGPKEFLVPCRMVHGVVVPCPESFLRGPDGILLSFFSSEKLAVEFIRRCPLMLVSRRYLGISTVSSSFRGMIDEMGIWCERREMKDEMYNSMVMEKNERSRMRGRKNPMGDKCQAAYERWWKGKFCRLSGSTGPFKRVIQVEYVGSTHGVVYLRYEDKTTDRTKDPISDGSAWRPRKSDIEVEGEKERTRVKRREK